MNREQKNAFLAKEILGLVLTMKKIKKTNPIIFKAMMKEISK